MNLLAITMQVERLFTALLKGKEGHAQFIEDFVQNVESIKIP